MTIKGIGLAALGLAFITTLALSMLAPQRNERADLVTVGRIESAHESHISSLCFSPDGQFVASASTDGTAKLSRVRDGKLETTIRGDDRWMNSVIFSGKQLFAGGEDGVTQIWDIATKKQGLFDSKHREVRCFATSPDGQTLAIGGDITVKLWSLKDRKEISAIVSPYRYSESGLDSVTFSADGKWLAASNGKTVVIWDLADKSIEAILIAKGCTSIGFSASGTNLLVADGGKDIAGIIRSWNTSTSTESTPLRICEKGFVYMALSKNGELAATSGGLPVSDNESNGQITVWNLVTMRPIAEFDNHKQLAYSLAFSPDGRLLAVGQSGQEPTDIRIWDLRKAIQSQNQSAPSESK